MTTRHELTAADGTPERPLPGRPAFTAHDDNQTRPPARIHRTPTESEK